MIFALLRYYGHILKYGKPQPTKEIDPVYGRKELQKNQIWYGMTALAIVGGLAIYVPLAVLIFYVGEKENNQGYTCKIPIPFCHFENLLPPPPKGPLSLGTKVKLFRIPKPSAQEDTRILGISNDEKISLPKLKNQIQLSSEAIQMLIDLNQNNYLEGLLEMCENIPITEQEEYEDGYPEIVGIFANEPGVSSCLTVNEEPRPINLEAFIDLFYYPEGCRNETVEVSIEIDKWGKYVSHNINKSIHLKLEEQINEHIPKLRFTPAIQGGRPIPVVIKVPFSFKLTY